MGSGRGLFGGSKGAVPELELSGAGMDMRVGSRNRSYRSEFKNGVRIVHGSHEKVTRQPVGWIFGSRPCLDKLF